jgi:hypothetical protein
MASPQDPKWNPDQPTMPLQPPPEKTLTQDNFFFRTLCGVHMYSLCYWSRCIISSKLSTLPLLLAAHAV